MENSLLDYIIDSNIGCWKCQQDLPMVKFPITYDLHGLCSNKVAMSIESMHASTVHTCLSVTYTSIYFVGYVERYVISN